MKTSYPAQPATTLEGIIALFALFSATVMGAVFGAGLMYLAIIKQWVTL